MPQTPSASRATIPRPNLFICGVAAMVGAVAGLVGDIVTVRLSATVSFVANTVSEGAAGPHSLWVDLGLTCQGGGLIAIGLGFYLWRGGTTRLTAGCVLLALTGLSLILLAWHNAYGDGEAGGLVIHRPLTLVVGLLFAGALGLLAKTLGELDTGYSRFSYIAVGAWLLLWPAFIMTPEGWNGAVERTAGVALILWMMIAGRVLMRRGRDA